MIHTRTSECSLHSSGAAAMGSFTPLWLLLLAASAIIDVYSLIRPPQTHHTDPLACLQSCKELFVCWRDGLDMCAHTHVHLVHTQTMDCLIQDPLMLFLHSMSLLFIGFNQTPVLFFASLPFSSFNLSLS